MKNLSFIVSVGKFIIYFKDRKKAPKNGQKRPPALPALGPPSVGALEVAARPSAFLRITKKLSALNEENQTRTA